MKAIIGCLCAASIWLSAGERTSSASRQAEERIAAVDESSRVIAGFLASGRPALASYRARRRLTASTRGGRMTGSLDAWTSVDPDGRFHYEVTNEQGSGLIRQRVLLAALEEERRTREEKDTKADLTSANYSFRVEEDDGGDFVKISLQPHRVSPRLLNGAVFATRDGLDMVRVEGTLSKSPSWWTRRIEITRRYARIAGVRVPTEMSSRADVRIVGDSTFSMIYEYVTVNGLSVDAAKEASTLTATELFSPPSTQ
jgi:hypothetical protein